MKAFVLLAFAASLAQAQDFSGTGIYEERVEIGLRRLTCDQLSLIDGAAHLICRGETIPVEGWTAVPYHREARDPDGFKSVTDVQLNNGKIVYRTFRRHDDGHYTAEFFEN